jgi:hypothetical protein
MNVYASFRIIFFITKGINFIYPKQLCQGQHKNTTWKILYEFNKQKNWQWIIIKWLYYLNKAWCQLIMRWIKNTTPQIALTILKGGVFKTFIYTIQWT